MRDYKKDFPIFSAKENDGLIYFDNAATAQKPRAVLEAVQTPTVGVPLPFRKVCRLDPVGSKIILEQSEHKRSVQKTFLMLNNEHLKQCNIKSNCRCYGVQFRNRQEGTGKKQIVIPK